LTKDKVKANTCYSTSYRCSECFTISEVAANQHELIIPQLSKRPFIARVNEPLDTRFAASRHTTAPISHTRTSPRSP